MSQHPKFPHWEHGQQADGVTAHNFPQKAQRGLRGRRRQPKFILSRSLQATRSKPFGEQQHADIDLSSLAQPFRKPRQCVAVFGQNDRNAFLFRLCKDFQVIDNDGAAVFSW